MVRRCFPVAKTAGSSPVSIALKVVLFAPFLHLLHRYRVCERLDTLCRASTLLDKGDLFTLVLEQMLTKAYSERFFSCSVIMQVSSGVSNNYCIKVTTFVAYSIGVPRI